MPEFTPKSQTEVTARVSNEPMHLERLSPENRAKLREILEDELAKRNGLNGHAATDRLPIQERER